MVRRKDTSYIVPSIKIVRMMEQKDWIERKIQKMPQWVQDLYWFWR